MEITLTGPELDAMPLQLRRELLAYIAVRMGVSPQAVHPSGEEPEFRFSAAPRGARHPAKKLVSFEKDQAKQFIREYAESDKGIWNTLHHLACSYCEMQRTHDQSTTPEITPAGLAQLLGLAEEDGAVDGRLISPHLKKVTHAVREYTGDPEAGWYTLDRAGDFYLDKSTREHLVEIFDAWHGRNNG